MATHPDGSPSTVRALIWSAAVEASSQQLPRRRSWSRRHREFVHDELIAFHAELDPNPTLPVRGLFVDQDTGASLLRAEQGDRQRSQSLSDILLVGTFRQPTQLRFRAFYVPHGFRRSGRTLVVHQRRKSHLAMPLATGARVQEAVAGQIPFAVPRLLDVGTHALTAEPGRAVADWSVEEALDGVRVLPSDAARTSREVMALLIETGRRLGAEHRPLDPSLRSEALAAFEDLVQDPPIQGWPCDLDPQQVQKRVRWVLHDERLVTMGFSHGDPGLNNLVRMRDGTLGLVDWEDAGRRMLAHDLVKVARSAPDPLSLIPELAQARPTAPPGRGVTPWSEQLAISLLVFQRAWRVRHDRALMLGRPGVQRRRLHTSLRMIARLLDAD